MSQGIWNGASRTLVHPVQMEEGVHKIWRLEQLHVIIVKSWPETTGIVRQQSWMNIVNTVTAEVLTADFWDVALSSLVDYRCFGGI